MKAVKQHLATRHLNMVTYGCLERMCFFFTQELKEMVLHVKQVHHRDVRVGELERSRLVFTRRGGGGQEVVEGPFSTVSNLLRLRTAAAVPLVSALSAKEIKKADAWKGKEKRKLEVVDGKVALGDLADFFKDTMRKSGKSIRPPPPPPSLPPPPPPPPSLPPPPPPPPPPSSSSSTTSTFS